MTEAMVPAETVIGVAIDHRSRRLFMKVAIPVGTANIKKDTTHAFDDVIAHIDQKARTLPPSEIDVTKRLAGPYGVAGGITVVLQQPAEGQKFDKGTAHTVQQCATLRNLHEIFLAVSLFSVGISDINVLDTLPCVLPSDEKQLDHGTLRVLQDKVFAVVQTLAPKVIMCTSRKPDPSGSLKSLKSLGIGKSMEQAVSVGTHSGYIKVNAFHPSFALYYQPTDPEIRQLLILEAVQVCGHYNGAWQEEDWMDKLRASCASRYAGTSSSTDSGPRYPKDRLDATVTMIREATMSITKTTHTAFSEDFEWPDLGDAYSEILNTKLSTHYNQLTLSIQQMKCLETEDFAFVEDVGKRKYWKKEFDRSFEEQLGSTMANCRSMVENFPAIQPVWADNLNSKPETIGHFEEYFLEGARINPDTPHLNRWRDTLNECAKDIYRAYTCKGRDLSESSIARLASASLECALKVERFLGTLEDEIASQHN